MYKYCKSVRISPFTFCPIACRRSYLDQTPNVDPEGDYDFAIFLGGEDGAADKADGIEKTIEKISKAGDVYSIDGKLLMTGATLNSLKALGKGMYILNGVKVLVK